MITHEIIGDDMQAVVLTLTERDEVRAGAGAMTYMTDGIEIGARMQGGINVHTGVAAESPPSRGSRSCPVVPRRSTCLRTTRRCLAILIRS